MTDPKYLKYLETRAELLHMQLSELQAAAAVVCIKANLRKSSLGDFQRLANAVRNVEWSAQAEQTFKRYYNEPATI